MGKTLTNSVDRWLLRAILTTSVLLLLLLAAFGGYYYVSSGSRAGDTSLGGQLAPLEKQVRERPNDAELRVALANLYVEKGRLDDAIGQAKAALQLRKDHGGALLVLGTAYMNDGEYDEAIQVWQRLVELNKDNPMAKQSPELALVHHNLGNIYLQRGQLDDAVTEFEASLATDRTNADTYFLLGEARLGREDAKGAVEAYRQALRLTPGFSEAYTSLNKAYQAEGNAAGASYAQAMLLYLDGLYDEAIAKLEVLAAGEMNAAEVHLGMGMAYEKLGKKGKAYQEYEAALSLDPKSYAARQGLGRLGAQP